MNPVGKALWFIESNFSREITLEEVAAVAGVSRYYMSRAFAEVTGRPALKHARGRRLTEAARALAGGAPDILAVALSAGYGSHEAFTRAFRDQFGVTPESVRAQRHVSNLQLVEPLEMDTTPLRVLQPPRFETGEAMLIAGLAEHYTPADSSGIPAQWQRFVPSIGHVPGQLGDEAYGVCYNPDDEGGFDYLAGVAVRDFSRLSGDWARLRLAPQSYAVFIHDDHISTIRRTWNTIWTEWLPGSGRQAADAPTFERYGRNFDSRTGVGDIQIWIPLAHGSG